MVNAHMRTGVQLYVHECAHARVCMFAVVCRMDDCDFVYKYHY